MLKVPKLDDLSFDQLFERARARIPTLTEDWTDFNAHDPGITTLQTFAWLVDTLNFYIDATGEEHRLKYLKLLGLAPVQSAASCHVALSSREERAAVARGAKLLAGHTVFETTEAFEGTVNKVKSLFRETDGVFADLTPFAGVDGGYAEVFALSQESRSALYIGFEQSVNGVVRFYVDVCSHPARQPFTDDFRLSSLTWEYWNGREWRPAALTEDQTRGFLRGGFIALSLDGATQLLTGHIALPGAHWLRARLIRNDYDAAPQIGSIYPCCVPVIQTDTHAQALEITYPGGREMTIDYHVGPDDVIRVGVWDGDGYSLWYEYEHREDSLCDVIDGKYPWQKVIRFDSHFPEAGQRILITIIDKQYFDKLQLGTTTGFASEKLELEMEDVFEVRLALEDFENNRRRLRLWDSCGDIRQAPCDAQVFQYDRGSQTVVFGDGIAGRQPGAGHRISAVTVKSSKLADGNVRVGRIDRFADSAYDGVDARNPKDAEGGQWPQTSDALENEIEKHVCGTTRAVSPQDYMDIVKATPGLMIDRVNVISGRTYGEVYGETYEVNTVFLAVKPYSEHEKRPVLSEVYRDRILDHLENYRLLTTDVRIVSARYVGIEVNGRVVLTEGTIDARRRVNDKLAELIDFSHRQAFGARISVGRILSHLEMLDCVKKVTELSFSRLGEGAQKGEQGDIQIFPDALPWLHSINIEFVAMN